MTKRVFIKLYKNLKLRTKIFLWVFTIVLLTAFSISVFSFNQSYNYAIDSEAQKQALILKNIQKDTNDILQSMQYAAISVSCDEAIIDVLSTLEENGYEKSKYDIQKAFYSQAVIENTNDVCIFSSLDNVFTSIKEADVIEALKEQYKKKEEYLQKNVIGFLGLPVIKRNGSAVIPYFRQIKDYATGEYLGAAVVYIYENKLSSTYRYYSNADMMVMMLSEGRDVIASGTDKYINSNFEDLADNSSPDGSKNYFKAHIDNKYYFCVQRTDVITGYTYISLMPMNIVMQTPNTILTISVVIMVIALVLAIAVSLALSNTIAKPISNLVRVMDKTHNMQEIHSMHYKYNDEIGMLIKSFANMSERLNNSLSIVLEEQEKRRLAEYNALKWQINPHFLYNTLSSIVWLSKNNENTKVIEVTKSLTTLLKIGISKDKELISIKDEMEHVKSYLEIQMLRYEKQFKYIFDVEPDCLNYYTVKIVVQPLVENAIYHGVRDKSQGGIIKVVCRQQQDTVVIDVSDNGDKMTQEHAEKLNDFIAGKVSSSDEKFGIGIKNVHDRIRYYFKGEYGLEFIRNEGITIARIKIPVVKNTKK